jgi:predicted porin
MKTKFLAATVFALAAQGAFAQSSVTLYGVLDDGLTYLSNVNGKKVVQMESGNLWGAIWGMKGTEDLGGGMKALFQIEGGFDVNSGRSGQGGLPFGHNTYVGLGSDRYGTVTLGRQFDSMSIVLGNYSSCYLYGGSGFHFNDNDNVCQSVRFNNAINYVSPTIGGVTGYATLALGNQSQFSQNRSFAVAVNYTNGGFSAGAGYLNVNDAGSPGGPFDSKGVGTAISDPENDNYVGFMAGNYILLQDAQKWTVAGAGASYTIGKAVLTAEYTHSKYQNSSYLTDIGGAGFPLTNVDFNNYEVGALYNFTPAFSFNAGYTLSTMRLSAVSRETKFHIVQLLADYHFSKRTDVYYLVNYQVAAGDGTYFNGVSFSQAASVQGVSSNNHQLSTSLGIRHLF